MPFLFHTTNIFRYLFRNQLVINRPKERKFKPQTNQKMKNKNRIKILFKYLIKATFNEMLISLYNLQDVILPDWTVFSVIRRLFANCFWAIGKKTRIRKGLRAGKIGKLKIGDNCFINKDNLFDNSSSIEIGDNCSIGFNNKFLTTSHIEKDKIREENIMTSYSKPIKIGNGVWITTNCVILPGTEIGDKAIISAGSIVKGKLKGGWVYVGNPVKKIRKTEGILEKII